MHLTAKIACYELKGDFSQVMLKENFHDSLKISKFTSMENHSSVTGRHKSDHVINQCKRSFNGN